MGPASFRFKQCLNEASSRLCELVKDDPSLEGMGSTVIAAHYDGQELTWLSVGDSPMWLFSNKKLVRLNADHSMARVLDRMVENGDLSEEEARNDRRRNMLLSAVTGSPVEIVDCAKRSCRLVAQDRLLIASDGIQTLADQEIERQLAATEGTAESVADALLSAVRTASGERQDNMTFLLLLGEAYEKDTLSRVIGAEIGDGDIESSLEESRRNSVPFWIVLGLGLAIIGLLVATISSW